LLPPAAHRRPAKDEHAAPEAAKTAARDWLFRCHGSDDSSGPTPTVLHALFFASLHQTGVQTIDPLPRATHLSGAIGDELLQA